MEHLQTTNVHLLSVIEWTQLNFPKRYLSAKKKSEELWGFQPPSPLSPLSPLIGWSLQIRLLWPENYGGKAEGTFVPNTIY